MRFFAGFITACVLLIGGVLALEVADPGALSAWGTPPQAAATATPSGLPTAAPVAHGEYIQGAIQVGQQSIAMTLTSATQAPIGPLLFRWSCSLLPAGASWHYLGYALNTSPGPPRPQGDSGLRAPPLACSQPWMIEGVLTSGNMDTVSLAFYAPAHLPNGSKVWFVFYDGKHEVQTEIGERAAVVATVGGPPVSF